MLTINIGIGKGFSARGFIIHIRGKEFNTRPYNVTDVVDEGHPDSVYRIVYQKLRLNKPRCSSGDSLYGYIDFKLLETGKDADTTWHAAHGHFRAKISYPRK